MKKQTKREKEMTWFDKIMWVCKHLLNPINPKLDWRKVAGYICKKYSIGMAQHFADEFMKEFHTDKYRKIHSGKTYQHITQFFEIRKGEWKALQDKIKYTQDFNTKRSTPARDHWKKDMQDKYIFLMKRRRAGHDVEYKLYRLIVSMKHHQINIPGVDDDTLITNDRPTDNISDVRRKKA